MVLYDQQTIYRKFTLITLPGYCTIASIHKGLLDLLQLYINARIAHIVPALVHSSLNSFKQFFDAQCRVECVATNWYIYFKNQIILQGSRNEKVKLLILPFWNNATPTPPIFYKISKIPTSRKLIFTILILIHQYYENPIF